MPSKYNINLQDIFESSYSGSEFFERSTDFFSTNDEAFKDFLREYFLDKLNKYIKEQNGPSTEVNIDSKLSRYFPKASNEEYFMLQEYLDAFLPRERHSIWKSVVFIISLITPSLLLLYFIIHDLNLLILTVHLLWMGILGPILLILFFLVLKISPKTFRWSKFPRSLTIKEFIEQIVSMNEVFYKLDGFAKTRIILKELYSSGSST